MANLRSSPRNAGRHTGSQYGSGYQFRREEKFDIDIGPWMQMYKPGARILAQQALSDVLDGIIQGGAVVAQYKQVSDSMRDGLNLVGGTGGLVSPGESRVYEFIRDPATGQLGWILTRVSGGVVTSELYWSGGEGPDPDIILWGSFLLTGITLGSARWRVPIQGETYPAFSLPTIETGINGNLSAYIEDYKGYGLRTLATKLLGTYANGTPDEFFIGFTVQMVIEHLTTGDLYATIFALTSASWTDFDLDEYGGYTIQYFREMGIYFEDGDLGIWYNRYVDNVIFGDPEVPIPTPYIVDPIDEYEYDAVTIPAGPFVLTWTVSATGEMVLYINGVSSIVLPFTPVGVFSGVPPGSYPPTIKDGGNIGPTTLVPHDTLLRWIDPLDVGGPPDTFYVGEVLVLRGALSSEEVAIVAASAMTNWEIEPEEEEE